MRAALAPLVGLVGLLGATMVSAQENTLDAVVATQVPGETDMEGAPTIASETLSAGDDMDPMKWVTEGHYHVTTSSSTLPRFTRTNTNKPDKWLELRTEIDILLSHRGDSNHYYVRYELDGMVFSKAPPKPEVRLPYNPPCRTVGETADCMGDTATTTTYTSMVEPAGIEVAYRGRAGDSEVIFRLPARSAAMGGTDYVHPMDGTTVAHDPMGDYPVGTTVTLLLPYHLAVMAAPEATYTADVKVFEDLSEAREETFGAQVYEAEGDVIHLARAVGEADVTAMLAVAEVSTPEEMGGAFRRFVDGDGDEDTEPDQHAHLATVSVGLADPADPPLHAQNNLMPVDSSIITGVNVLVASDAGNFGFGASFYAGDCPPPDDGTSLGLWKPDGMGGLTMLAAVDSPDIATAASGMTGGGMEGSTDAVEFAFCIEAADHSDDMPAPAIPEVGDPALLNGYLLTATPTVAGDIVTPPEGTAMNAGAIDRNGTTVHISYLSGSENANQRLVIVNRGSDPARFWMSDFQAEANQMVTHSGQMLLAQATMSEVPGGGRMVVRVQDNLSFSGRPPRAAGTLTVAAPTRHIDVMTLQVVGGGLDTTVYQHAE